MGVYIKGMKMPESCTGCERWADCPEVVWYMGENFDFEDLMHSELNERRHGNCPLIEVPEPHGRLVDLDKMIEELWDGNSMEVGKFELRFIPTIVEAEGE